MKYLLNVDKKKVVIHQLLRTRLVKKKNNFFRVEFWYKKYCVFIKAYSFNVCKLKSNAVRVHEFAPVEHNFLWFTAKCFNFPVVCCCCARYFFFFFRLVHEPLNNNYFCDDLQKMTFHLWCGSELAKKKIVHNGLNHEDNKINVM